MNSLNLLAVFAIVLATYAFQGTLAREDLSDSQHERPRAKRSIEVLQFFPWLQNVASSFTGGADSQVDSTITQADGRSNAAGSPGVGPDRELHSVSKRSVDENQRSDVDQEEHLQKNLFRNKFVLGVVEPLARSQQGIVVIQHAGPAYPKPLRPAVKLTTPHPPAKSTTLPPPAITTAPVAVVEVASENPVVVPVKPIVAPVVTAVVHPATTTLPLPAPVTVPGLSTVAPPVSPLPAVVPPKAKCNKSKSCAAHAESARNDPISISNDLSIS